MPRFWKVMVGLAIVLPMVAYVVGSVTASSGGDPVRRDPVYIMDVPETPASEKSRRGTDPSPPPETQAPVDGHDDDADDNGVRVVTPQPTRVDGDDADDGPEGDDDDSRDGGDDSDDGEGD